jgi:catechol 2,3-dioxygenase-like lactoylglutathione lyase family enzyme
MRRLLQALLLAFALLPHVQAAEPQADTAFARTTIDLGTVVSDLEASVRFYKDVIGFTEVAGFDVPADMATDAGLTDGKPLSIRVLVLGSGPEATKLKLMQVQGTAPRKGDTDFIHSHTGFRYLTIFVRDTDAAVARLAKHGVKPLAKSPVTIPESIAPGLFLTCIRDPDGNIVELVGPKAGK